ncbi:MAG TPA: THUMP domain-containing protein [Flavobacteriaceae bacterium]|nr:THUMP domain-containing protein [Flavobacteriaceae bacterium]
MANFTMVAKTFAGLEAILAKELRLLGAGNIQPGIRVVSFEGDKGFMYKANLSLRTALRVLKPIAEFDVRSEDEFYRKIYDIDWEKYLNVEDSFAIDSTVHSEKFTHSNYVTLKAKDAIVDKFRNVAGKRPDIDLQNPKLRINIHINDQFCTVSLDSSGDSLHKRGYRKETGEAPINEVLAAGMLMHAGWDGRSDFLDPMCGSGTILIEAAMIALNIPANINNAGFGFKNWKDWDPELYDIIEKAQLDRIRDFKYEIIGYDISEEAVTKAKENVANANLSDFIKVFKADFFTSEKYSKGHLHMVFNPPYGERLAINIPEFYEKIGDTLKQNYPGSQAWFLTSDVEAMKSVGLRTSRRVKLYNGPLEARLLQYEIYEGTKKKKRPRIKRKK